MGGVTGFLNIVAATGGAALLLYSTDALFYYTDERRASKHAELDLKRRALEERRHLLAEDRKMSLQS
ncbi:hypothetical protein WJX79_004958 [Trebouxia sp. C0005]|nr:MAG: hypothetical protein FRX49_07651 [Trebouxia sp. A1-2]